MYTLIYLQALCFTECFINTSQQYGRSPVCTPLCTFRLYSLLNVLLTHHSNKDAPLWVHLMYLLVIRLTERIIKHTTQYVHSTQCIIKHTTQYVHSTQYIIKHTTQYVHSTQCIIKHTSQYVHSTQCIIKHTTQYVHSTVCTLH